MLICVNPRHLLVFFHLPYGFLYFRARTVSWKSTGPKMQISVQWAVCILTIINMDFYTYNTHVHIHISTYHKYILIYIHTFCLSDAIYIYDYDWLCMYICIWQIIIYTYMIMYAYDIIWHYIMILYDSLSFSPSLSPLSYPRVQSQTEGKPKAQPQKQCVSQRALWQAASCHCTRQQAK